MAERETQPRQFSVGDQVEITGDSDFHGDTGYILKPAHPDSPWDWVVGHYRGDWQTAVTEAEIAYVAS